MASPHLRVLLAIRVKTKYFQVLGLLSKQLIIRTHIGLQSNQDYFIHSKTTVRLLMETVSRWATGHMNVSSQGPSFNRVQEKE